MSSDVLSKASVPGGGVLLDQILDPAFLRTQLDDIRGQGEGILDKDQYGAIYRELDRAAEDTGPGGPGRQAYLPRSQKTSLLQSTITDCITSRFKDLVKPLPERKRSFAEFFVDLVSREADVLHPFGPCDAGWIESKISEGIAMFEKRPDFRSGPGPTVPISDPVRIVMVGDWGTALPGARAVGELMGKYVDQAKGGPANVHAVHLGDVYYSGWKEEYESRFLPFWPIQDPAEGVPSWTLNGNHDMYSGGHGYFGFLLRHPLFAGQQRSSYFCLENSSWRIVALDSSYEDHDLAGDQQSWLAEKLGEDGGKKTLLLTHHQPFSAYEEKVNPALEEKVKAACGDRRLDAWIWGHEHRCHVYKPNPRPYVGFASCLGHGGVPVLLEDGSQPEEIEWQFDTSDDYLGDKWQRFGFAVLDFSGERIDIRYFDHTDQLSYETSIE